MVVSLSTVSSRSSTAYMPHYKLILLLLILNDCHHHYYHAACTSSTSNVNALNLNNDAIIIPNNRSNSRPTSIDLQHPHKRQSPSEVMASLAEAVPELLNHDDGIDVYGDFDKSVEQSYLRRFEREVCTMFGKEDAVFMPSGVMAQSIALKIHSTSANAHEHEDHEVHESSNLFACHETSHLLLW